ncbi:hypothetical protein EDD18DRAFT_1195765 [Armillaria luteobubalina]|uniref:Uncharacterized protein n=1 Tax=Armillaria luteobubalina TaxID=153913 RepID=A0AA39PJK5_9AGAR|nr:hypothetical protein EDD18DRAFT_1195765 [Armillaria luteobubalina]
MTHSKSQPPPGNSNTISSSSRLGPPLPYREDIERGVNETSPLHPGRLRFFLFFAHIFLYFVLQRILLGTRFQIKSRMLITLHQGRQLALQTILEFSIIAVIFTLYLHEKMEH